MTNIRIQFVVMELKSKSLTSIAFIAQWKSACLTGYNIQIRTRSGDRNSLRVLPFCRLWYYIPSPLAPLGCLLYRLCRLSVRLSQLKKATLRDMEGHPFHGRQGSNRLCLFAGFVVPDGSPFDDLLRAERSSGQAGSLAFFFDGWLHSQSDLGAHGVFVNVREAPID
jgi:hypothetical protein